MSTFKNKKNIGSFSILIFLGLLLVLTIYFFSSKTLEDRLTLAIASDREGVALLVFDSSSRSITMVNVPKNTLVEVARQFGQWQLGSVWRLGKDEGLSGQLLAETVTKSLELPIDAWADREAYGFFDGGLTTLGTLFNLEETNLSLVDKLNLALFSLRVRSKDRVKIDILETGYFKKDALPGGDPVFVSRKKPPSVLGSLFSVRSISEEAARVGIIDATRKKTASAEIGEIIEALGTKVLAIQKVDEQDLDCEIRGKDGPTLRKISKLLKCKNSHDAVSGNLDIEIIIGTSFEKRF